MATTRQYRRRPRRAALTHTQAMELWLDAGSSGSSFESDAHKREVWFRHREKLMAWWGKGGRRPMGWWCFEAREMGLRFPGQAHERSALYEFTDVLSADERAQLEAEWRKEFDRSWDEHFFFCAGPDKIFTGDDARWQHWLFVDLPPPLLDKFMAERERRGQVIREQEGVPAEATAEDEDYTGKHVA